MIHWKAKVVYLVVAAAGVAATAGSLGGLLRALGCAW
jgi:hypothetical protein